MRTSIIIAIVLTALAWPSFLDDLRSRGIPADSASAADTVLLVHMSGSLSEGDSLLKHYGGAFFLYADSVVAGWPVMELRVYIPTACLVLRREDMFNALSQLQRDAPSETVALWILEHTFVYNR